MDGMIIRINGVKITPRKYPEEMETVVPSKWTGETETFRKKFVAWASAALTMAAVSMRPILANTHDVAKIHDGFNQIMDVFTALAEPVLWFYAVIGAIMMATGKNKEKGWERVKQVGYAYVFIQLLPTFFKFCHWVAVLISTSITI